MEDTVCSGCSLLCDDVAVELNEGTVRSLGLCRLGRTHLESALQHVDVKCFSRENGESKEISLVDAIQQASAILLGGGTPLLFGWSQISNEGISEGFALAAELKGYFDSMASLGASQALRHPIHSMTLGTTLDHVRNNAEFVIYWGSDPTESLHRHPSRFAVLPRGDNIPEGIESRTIGVVDVRKTETMKMANHRLVIPIGRDSELLKVVTAELSGKSSISGEVAGIPAAELIGFVRGLQKSDCSVVFYGSGLLNSAHASENLQSMQELIETIRANGKEAYAMPMFPDTNVMGVIKTVSKETSAPSAIDFSSGTAVYASDETSLQRIVRGDFAKALLVGDDALAVLPGPAARVLASMDIVYIGPSGTVSDKLAKLSIHVPDTMIVKETTMSRIDQESVKMKGISHVKAGDLTVQGILKRIRETVEK